MGRADFQRISEGLHALKRFTVAAGICANFLVLTVVTACTAGDTPASDVAHGSIDGQQFSVLGHATCDHKDGKSYIQASDDLPEDRNTFVSVFVPDGTNAPSTVIIYQQGRQLFERTAPIYTITQRENTWHLLGSGDAQVDTLLTCP